MTFNNNKIKLMIYQSHHKVITILRKIRKINKIMKVIFIQILMKKVMYMIYGNIIKLMIIEH